MKSNLSLTLFKIVLTIPVAYALLYPFLNPEVGGGVFKELELLGPIGSAIVAAVFLGLIVFYCLDLQRSLSLVRPGARVASPRSVWLMFLLPYNFVEDFFIIAHVAKSLAQEAQFNASLRAFKSFGWLSGMGWCAAQIVSLLPNEIGSLAGLLALALWILHWRLIRRINSALLAASELASAQPA
ncbi:hypothetical protein DBR47_24085 [Paucibacter sp. KBW04]|uniref:hypothetical protein n=1 Tax=Paucibacter sp. KBW04 TaxID=2153361 RepID=UPI000F56508E|nr:hypothetical protein [Paucibacter sp. KBW04]RQO53500.1 hypothetical protein DBR47_24085 [Paucibacter sp. KBW04]